MANKAICIYGDLNLIPEFDPAEFDVFVCSPAPVVEFPGLVIWKQLNDHLFKQMEYSVFLKRTHEIESSREYSEVHLWLGNQKIIHGEPKYGYLITKIVEIPAEHLVLLRPRALDFRNVKSTSLTIDHISQFGFHLDSLSPGFKQHFNNNPYEIEMLFYDYVVSLYLKYENSSVS